MADLPADDNTPIQQLAVQEGLCWSECWYLTISQQLMSQHWIANQEDSSAEDGRPQHDGLSSWTEAGRESLIHDGWETHIAAYEARITAEDVERCRTIDHKPGIDFESPLGRTSCLFSVSVQNILDQPLFLERNCVGRFFPHAGSQLNGSASDI
ncbi:uncharacterized protein B0I36DRAFT_356426 [Microdochium trichocladiopsis]|uniref:Uncharacterized protein n=1 Tax=Microdochium trichocladiopsis TaxID=1682393 RepID=A0A9P8XQE6_9PEZI|nr:uncharacterized protein B0I36DRAFT_356426 [Microdochium trichocladiopsis]KAH7010813.1 hypothetical protein B0I36DRAFT_356426 [Microdochium trichocladiopsis]